MAEYNGTTVSVSKQTVNPFRKNAYDPDFVGADALNVRQFARWKGYNGYWKTLLSLKTSRPVVRTMTPGFNLSYHERGLQLADVRRRGMYGY